MMMPVQADDHDLLKLLADSLPGLVCYLDRGRRFRFLNARFRDWIGLDPAACQDKTLEEVLGPEVDARLQPHLARVFAGKVVTLENDRMLGGTRLAHLRTRMAPHRSGDGNILGAMIFTLDVTEDWRARETFRASRDEAIQTSRTMSELLAAASHDLRQPLHALTLFARALGRRVETEEAKELVGHMEAALHSLRDMINALLDMSKLDAGLIEPHIEAVSLPALLEPLRAGFAAIAAEQGLRFRLWTIDAVVLADAALLETMLRNLIANALKFTGSGGVLVGCRRRGRRVRIEIYDTGPGIAEDRLEEVFGAYQRSAAKAKGENEGLGLGLAIVRHLADLLELPISVRSVVGRGSRFAIDLPIADATTDPIRPVPPVADDRLPVLRARRILVLDDDHAVCQALAQELIDHGAEVVTASSRTELLARLPELEHLAAAIVDYELADGVGPEVLATLNRRLGLEVPVVVMTGTTDPAILAELDRGGYCWLVKPVDPPALLSALRAILPEPKEGWS